MTTRQQWKSMKCWYTQYRWISQTYCWVRKARHEEYRFYLHKIQGQINLWWQNSNSGYLCGCVHICVCVCIGGQGWGETGNLIWTLLNLKRLCHICPHLQSQLFYHHQCEPGNERPESLVLVYGTKGFRDVLLHSPNINEEFGWSDDL